MLNKIVYGIICFTCFFIITFNCEAVESLDEYSDTDGYILMGDANNDKKVNADDALLLLKIIANLEPVDSHFSIRKNDFNSDYKVNTDDVLHILKIAVKLEKLQTKDDPNNYYDNMEYINGYPSIDYMKVENGENLYSPMYLDQWKTYIFKFLPEYKGSTINLNQQEDILKIYWATIWLAQDATEYELFEATDREITTIDNYVRNNFENSYKVKVVSGVSSEYFNTTQICYYITEDNNIFVQFIRRSDVVPYNNNEYILKYTGKVPDNLTYESIEKLYMLNE